MHVESFVIFFQRNCIFETEESIVVILESVEASAHAVKDTCIPELITMSALKLIPRFFLGLSPLKVLNSFFINPGIRLAQPSIIIPLRQMFIISDSI